MADEPVKTMGRGCFGGLLGAFLGIIIGGYVGPVIATSKNDLRNNPDPFAKEMSGLFDGCLGFVGLLLGAGIGGIVGGIGGSVVSTALAANASSSLREEPPSVKDNAPEPPTESPDAERARLKQRLAELEDQ